MNSTEIRALIREELRLLLSPILNDPDLDPPVDGWGDKYAAKQLLNVSFRTLDRYRQHWIEGIHYAHQGGKVIYNLPLLSHWRHNRHDPISHQKAIESWQTQQLGNRKPRKPQ